MSESEEERIAREREVLGRVAQALIDRRLTAPAILFLESVKPLSFLASQALIFLGPMLETLLDRDDYRTFAEAMEDRANVEWLIQQLEDSQ